MKTRIMIIDDDKILLKSYRRLFIPHLDTYELSLESNPKTALEGFSKETIDICISDYLMPGMDGAELLKNAKKTMGCLTILLSGEKLPSDFDKSDIDHILTKPCLPSELFLIIENARMTNAGQ